MFLDQITSSIKKLFDSTTVDVVRKTKNPFLLTYLLVWIVRNWEFVYRLFYFDDKWSLDGRVSWITNHFADYTFGAFLGQFFANAGLALLFMFFAYILILGGSLITDVYSKIDFSLKNLLAKATNIADLNAFARLQESNESMKRQLQKLREDNRSLNDQLSELTSPKIPAYSGEVPQYSEEELSKGNSETAFEIENKSIEVDDDTPKELREILTYNMDVVRQIDDILSAISAVRSYLRTDLAQKYDSKVISLLQNHGLLMDATSRAYGLSGHGIKVASLLRDYMVKKGYN